MLIIVGGSINIKDSAYRISEQDKESQVIVINSAWVGQSNKQPKAEKTLFNDVKTGDILYKSSYGSITVKNITEGALTLELLPVEVDVNGEVIHFPSNFRLTNVTELITEFNLVHGEALELHTEGVIDAGDNVTVIFN